MAHTARNSRFLDVVLDDSYEGTVPEFIGSFRRVVVANDLEGKRSDPVFLCGEAHSDREDGH
eukprot:14188132-Alexandrium_andersonii.AAC.1